MTTPYAIAFCPTPAEGAIVTLELGSPNTCQLSGYEMVNALCWSGCRLLLGFTCCAVTLPMFAFPPGFALPCEPLVAGGKSAGVAPLDEFCCAQRPCLAPSAISCAV